MTVRSGSFGKGTYEHAAQGGWPPQQPPPYGQPFDPSAFNPQQQPPPPGWQQGSWPQPSPPPQKGNSVKWLLIAVAVLLVIAISVGVTLIFTRDSGGGQAAPTTSGVAPSDVASAGDRGPVSIITDEPTCKAFNGINNSLANLQNNGWGDQRSTLGPASHWTPDQRAQVQAVATAMHNAADQTVALAKQTPHRLVRELYEQFIAYGRAYADSIPTYTPADDGLASANVSISATLFGICDAIDSGAANRGLSVQSVSPPTNVAALGNPADPQRFVTASDGTCGTWEQNSDKFDAGTADWQKLDPGIPAAQWTPERRAVHQAALPFLTTWAAEMADTGRKSGNPVLEDFAVAAAQYIRAYVSVGDSYVGSDSWLNYIGVQFNQTFLAACRAVAG